MNKIGETNLTHQTKFRLNELTKIENCFNQEINQRKLSKYVAAFDYMDKILILLSAAGGGDCIFSTVSAVALIDLEISHEKFIAILKEKDTY